jgi:hypothetical protein
MVPYFSQRVRIFWEKEMSLRASLKGVWGFERRLLKGALLTWVTLTMTASLAQAGLIFSVSEAGSDIAITLKGSIDTTGWNLQGVTPSNIYLRGDTVAVGSSNMQRIDGNIVAVTGGASVSQVFPPVGWGIYWPMAGSAKGDTVIFQTNTATAWILYLPAGYASNDSISGASKFSGINFATLGMDGHTYWKWFLDGDTGNDAKSITVQAVPEPSSFVLGGIGLVVAGLVRRWKSRN